MANVSTLTNCGIFEPPVKPKITKEMKASMKQSGLSPAEQKAALNEQLAQMKAKYEADLAVWKAKPNTPQEEVDTLRANWEKTNGSYKEKKAAINATYKSEVAEAKAKSDPSARKLAITLAKNKQHNAILDLNEELRLAKHALNQATLSSDEIYKAHQRVKLRAAIWRDRHLYLMLIPFVAFFIIFMYLPMYGHLRAYSEVRGRR